MMRVVEPSRRFAHKLGMRNILAIASLAVLAGCVAPSVPPPRPAPPAPVRVPAPAPAPPPPAYGGDWRDWPLARGTWVYRQDARGSIALFGVRDADAELTLRCDRLAGQLYLSRRGATPGQMTIRTSSTARSLAAQPAGGTPSYMAVALTAADTLLDAIAYSRGRFIVETPPAAPLVVPAWSEFARVVEDCRR
jgi:hypothetical protein